MMSPPRMSKSSMAVSSASSVRSPSDHPLLAERPHLIGAEAAEARQYRLRMLAHERRPSGGERRVGQAYRTADHREPSARRVVDVIDHAALAQVRVGQHLSGVEDGTADHAAAGEGGHHLMFAA